jgi:hypothetical protein
MLTWRLRVPSPHRDGGDLRNIRFLHNSDAADCPRRFYHIYSLWKRQYYIKDIHCQKRYKFYVLFMVTRRIIASLVYFKIVSAHQSHINYWFISTYIALIWGRLHELRTMRKKNWIRYPYISFISHVSSYGTLCHRVISLKHAKDLNDAEIKYKINII